MHKLLEEKRIRLDVTPAARELVLKEGYHQEFGARPLRRAIQRLIQDPLAMKILNGEIGEGDVVIVDADGDKAEMQFAKKQTIAA